MGKPFLFYLYQRVLHYPAGFPPGGQDVLWRCEAKRYSVVIDAEREIYGSSAPQLEMRWFPVVRRTPHGAWIDGNGIGELRFIKLTANKRFAVNTQKEAIESYKARKEVQKKILQGQLDSLEEELTLVDLILEEPEPSKL
jgi:hypothetical protein